MEHALSFAKRNKAMSDDDPVMIECANCEGKGQVVVDMRWRPGRFGDRWDDVWSACKHCEGTGAIKCTPTNKGLL
jgi:DnaJ-class molecular chaperone